MVESSKTGSEAFGETIRRARELQGMSRRDLAETTGLSYPYISQIETGYRMPSTTAMRSLADALGLRPDSLFDVIPPVVGRDAAVWPAAAASATPPADAPIPAAPLSVPRVAQPMAAPRGPATSRASLRGGSAAGGAPARSTAAAAPADAAGAAPVGEPADPVPGGAPGDLRSEAAGGWIANRSFRRNAEPSAAAPAHTGIGNRAIDQAATLLMALPSEDRLSALTEVQARVVRSVVDDELRRDRSH